MLGGPTPRELHLERRVEELERERARVGKRTYALVDPPLILTDIKAVGLHTIASVILRADESPEALHIVSRAMVDGHVVGLDYCVSADVLTTALDARGPLLALGERMLDELARSFRERPGFKIVDLLGDSGAKD